MQQPLEFDMHTWKAVMQRPSSFPIIIIIIIISIVTIFFNGRLLPFTISNNCV